MNQPSGRLVVDASVLIAAVLGRSSGAMKIVNDAVVLLTSERVIEETRRRLALGLKRPDLLPVVDALLATMTVVPSESLAPLIPQSEIVLKEAVASRNGSTKDAHVLALAWSVDGDIWSMDRDFAGTGVASWSTPNLLRGLAGVAEQLR